MKGKINLKAFLVILVLAFAVGYSGLITFANPNSASSQGGARLVGVLVTEEPLDLFDMEAFVKDHPEKITQGGEIDLQNKAQYQQALYARRTEDQDYDFDGIQGYKIMWIKTDLDGVESDVMAADEAFCQVNMTNHLEDGGQSINLSATIYFTSARDSRPFYTNPIYQDVEGRVFTLPGSAISYEGGDSQGMAFSSKLEEAASLTGPEGYQGWTASIEVNFSGREETKGLALVQFDRNHQVLIKTDFDLDSLPDQVTMEKQTAYAILETQALSGIVTRAVYQKEDQTLSLISPCQDGICLEHPCEIIW